jgi:hypothetical protein
MCDRPLVHDGFLKCSFKQEKERDGQKEYRKNTELTPRRHFHFAFFWERFWVNPVLCLRDAGLQCVQ